MTHTQEWPIETMQEQYEPPLLEIVDLRVWYGAATALKGVDFVVERGEVVVIIGSNGAGKTTIMKTISGVVELRKTVEGQVLFYGTDIAGQQTHKIQQLGISHVPEGRRIFPESTVEENLMLGAYTRFKRERGAIAGDLDAIFDRFPVLGERRKRPAGYLSGGEQQMLAIGRALMSRPFLLLLDEPSLGLAPLIVADVFEIIKELAAGGTTILLVEQMANMALEIADRAYVLETGEITLEGTGAQLLEDPRVKEAYLGA